MYETISQYLEYLELEKGLSQNTIDAYRRDLYDFALNVEDLEIFDSIFTDKNVVLTGTLDGVSRDDASAYIEQLGGKIVSSVSKKTDFVLCGENAGSKLDKAKSLGIKIIYLEDLIKELQNYDIKINK